MPTIARRLRCWWRGRHECSLNDLRRIGPERVTCRCRRCGALLAAEYGLALNCKWIQP